jgi:hypothetical protein
MPYPTDYDDYDSSIEEYEYSDEDEDEDDFDEDSESMTVPCPQCREEIYEDSDRCPYCGEYILSSNAYSALSHPWKGRNVVWVILGLLGALSLIFALLSPF